MMSFPETPSIFHARGPAFQGTQSDTKFKSTPRRVGRVPAQVCTVQGAQQRPREDKRECKVGMQGKHAESLHGHAILQWRFGKGRKTRLAPITHESTFLLPAFFPDRGGPSFNHAVEASCERKEEGCEQSTARTRRTRGWCFEQVV